VHSPRVSGFSKQMVPAGPLAGYRILEFGANFTGPFATMLLGDQGADVIKVESPEGDQIRYSTSARGGISAAFISTNRNKRSVVLDMKKPAAIAAFRRLVKSCDVVVQNFRPGVVDRLGLGYDDLKKVRGDLIFVSVSGFGSDGPYSKQRVYDTVIQGVAGIAGTQRDPDTRIPCMVRSAIVDKVTALTVAQAITAALLARERSGKGQHVRVDMLNAMLSFWWPDVMSNQTFIGPGATAAGTIADARLIYKTRDDYVLAACMSNAEWKGLVTAIGKPELADDPRFRTMPDRVAHLREQYEELKDGFLSRTTQEWLAILRELDAVCAPVNAPENLCDDPQIRGSGIIWQGEHPVAGTYRQPIHPIQFEQTPAEIRRHAPMLGEHTDEVLHELGFGTNEIERLHEQDAIKTNR
jgi:crotonobetainyl-CoA:carnitine CoA-transferase CaiB-like acyl-CoA transferase